MDKLKGILRGQADQMEDEYRLKKSNGRNMRRYMTVDIHLLLRHRPPARNRLIRYYARKRSEEIIGHPKKVQKDILKNPYPTGYTTWIHSISLEVTMPPWKNRV